MPASPRRRVTYADIESAPDGFVAEIVEGELHTTPRPVVRHSAVASTLGVLLGAPFQEGLAGGPGGWWILDEVEVHLFGGEAVLVPDLAGWRREEVPQMPDRPFVEIPPAWVCEVLSPSTAALDRGKKLPAYARARVAHAWLVDPIARTLEVLRLEGEGWRLVATHAGEAIVRPEPFAAVALELGRVFRNA